MSCVLRVSGPDFDPGSFALDQLYDEDRRRTNHIAAGFLCFWLAMSVGNSFLNGWYSLAKRFRVDELPDG